jgi:hypothetical protein
MLGTFVAEPDEGGLSYGLTHPLKSNNPFRIALRQWGILLRALGRAQGLPEGSKILFGRPEDLDTRAL